MTLTINMNGRYQRCILGPLRIALKMSLGTGKKTYHSLYEVNHKQKTRKSMGSVICQLVLKKMMNSFFWGDKK